MGLFSSLSSASSLSPWAAVTGGVLGAVGSYLGAKSASKAAKAAAAEAAAQKSANSSTLSSYTNTGTTAENTANALLASNQYLNGSTTFSAPTGENNPYANSAGAFEFNGADLATTPGYQFQLQQGTQAAENAASASGLSVSGAQSKALASYAQGLADSTYSSQFANQLSAYNTNYSSALSSFNTNLNQAQNTYSDYMGEASLGENAANSLVNANSGLTSTQAAATTAAGAATAAGTSGATSSLANGLYAGASSYYANLLSQAKLSGTSSSTGTTNTA